MRDLERPSCGRGWACDTTDCESVRRPFPPPRTNDGPPVWSRSWKLTLDEQIGEAGRRNRCWRVSPISQLSRALCADPGTREAIIRHLRLVPGMPLVGVLARRRWRCRWYSHLGPNDVMEGAACQMPFPHSTLSTPSSSISVKQGPDQTRSPIRPVFNSRDMTCTPGTGENHLTYQTFSVSYSGPSAAGPRGMRTAAARSSMLCTEMLEREKTGDRPMHWRPTTASERSWTWFRCQAHTREQRRVWPSMA